MRQIKWILPLGFILLYLIPLGMHPLWMPDETRYAEISREMVAGGSWIVPHFMGMHYFEKPILGYWMNNICQMLFGYNNFAARLAPVLSIGLTALILYYLVLKILKDERKAFYSALVYLTSPLVFGIGTYNTLDSMLTLWMGASFASFYYAMQAETRRQLLLRYLLFGVLAGGAFLTKGFVALAMLVIAIIPFMLLIRKLPQVLTYGWVALIAAIIISLPWAIAVALKAPDYWNFFFWNENIRRFAAEDAQHMSPWWYYIPLLLPALLPWLFLAPRAIVHSLKDQSQRHFFLYQVCCFLLPFILLSIAKGKLLTYILPLFMPLAILVGCGLSELAREHARILKTSAWVNGALGLILALVLTLMQLGLVGKPLYQSGEMERFWFGLVLFGWWGVLPLLGLRHAKRLPLYLAAAPIGLFLLIPSAIPMKVVNNKLPQVFYTKHLDEIQPNAWVLTNSVALVGDIGWQLHRSDIDLLNSYGELQYGIKRSKQQRYFTYAQFREQLAEKRQTQQVVLALNAKPDDGMFKELPTPTLKFHEGNFYLYLYQKMP
ncbi:lipid IV(A) 4-amino-4-deoxy-L-arabinosyltransferase [Dongshaea marina]|uniref:lipid IV(A) 4-amino-4-deoxy-L-arabinosyltransferase n=1 Tax=Dongshaea marina TaxID=2047966 RepID=UPI000D3ED753|nr:lipid IV(A) 4-amino-4-deoxy-L-arabinosyltransferase [Dongshaea marina]